VQKADNIAPLTDQERSLYDPRKILLAQPDFVADLNFFVSEGFGAYGGSEHVVRKGERYREESQFWVFVGEIGKGAVRLYPEQKVYDEMVPPRIGVHAEGLINARAFALDSTNSFSALGIVEVDGHRCLKIEVLKRPEHESSYLYAALDLKNLILVKQTLAAQTSAIQRLTNVSLDVPDGVVEIPQDFKPIEHVRWTKVESARVVYKGKPSTDFGAFRAPGGELFIWINDAYYPWHYLYRPEQKTVEIAYQGLLLNKSGTYIWKTKATEAFSVDYYGGPPTNTVDTHVVELPNGIKFHSENYEQDKSVIEIDW